MPTNENGEHMTPTPPVRTPEQRQEALVEALRARRERAKVKASVTKTPVRVLEVLDIGQRASGDLVLAHMHIGELLLAVDGIGDVTAANMILEAGVTSEDAHLDQLTAAEVESLREQLVAWLETHE